MKLPRWIVLLLTITVVAACTRATETPSLPTPASGITPAPSVESAMRSYLDALVVEDYASMYALLAQPNRDAMTQEDFATRYTEALNAMAVSTIEYSIQSTLTNPDSAQAAYRVIYHSNLFEDLQRDFNVNLTLEDGTWHLQWDTGLILPEMAGGKRLVAYHTSPARGDIYDRNGNALVTQSDVYALGLISGGVAEESENALFNLLYRLTAVRPDVISSDYFNYNDGDYVPVGEASAEAVENSPVLNFDGVYYDIYNSRFYEPGIGAHVTGYIRYIGPEEINDYRRIGYSGAERIGETGIERWAEEILHGTNAASLHVVSDDKQTVESTITTVDSTPASSIYLTIDSDLQEQAQAAMDGLPGAIVVMEMNTGRILALVSSPDYDPNLFDVANNYNSGFLLGEMVNDPNGSLTNRATTGTYPLGSVFKIISMATALESGEFTADSTYDCQYDYTELEASGGPTLHDWTYTRCENEKAQTGEDTCTGVNTQPSGLLTLPQGLMRSCNPWFYHIGFTLFNAGQGNAISDMARAFGLGSETGIEQIEEEPGFIPNPTDGTNATSIAIGQGDVRVTPLQVARFIAAIGNGGTLYRPQLVEMIQPTSGDPIQVFKPEAMGTLPISEENLQIIQDAMRSVVEDPRGTAYSRLSTFGIDTAAKTGTAETGDANPNAWFAGYSIANRPDKPDIAVAVVVNFQGEGSVWAAPIFRRIMEIYFYGQPGAIYPWETTYGVVNPDYGIPVTPTPEP